MWCRNNWIEYKFGNNAVRQSNESLVLTFNAKARAILPLAETSAATAKEIYATHKNIFVAMSGGCDSEFVADSFVRAGVPFTPIILTCEKFLNIHKWYVDHWCAKNNKKLEVIDIGFDMLMSVAKKKAEKIKATNGLAVFSSIVGDFVKSRGGFLVTGAMPAYWPDPKLNLGRNTEDCKFSGFYIDEDDFYIEALDPDYHPWCFAYQNPEILASIIHEWNPADPVEENKWRIFSQNPRPKLNGGEMILQNAIANQIPEYYNKISWTQDCKNNSTRDFYPLTTKQQLLTMLCE